jgi:predicted DNA-binding transcriptional regulator YafY
MPINKQQLQRLIKLTAKLKKNDNVNCKTFAAELNKNDFDNVGCCRKTILRDIKFLIEEHGAPIKFDRRNNKYYLTHKGWNFDCPQLLDESEMLAAVLGARLAEEIFPEPLRSDIRNAVDTQLTNNNPDFLDSTQISALIVVPRLKIDINPDIFMTMFQAWQNHEAVDIVYESADCTMTERRIEPHLFAFYDQAWYVKGMCHLRNVVRSFAVHRIIKAQNTGLYFELDQALIKRTAAGDFLEYPQIENIEIVCANELKSFIKVKPFHPAQTFTKYDDTHFLLKIPAVPEHEIVKWVLYQSGHAKLIKPAQLKLKINDIAKNIAEIHCTKQ